ncbi:unnamed protein product [Danaus chrysippus]|uniref:(African queen) hypothetical protein n=1 Tax=Danaus chrysippus TaxID=151541 RepID=A0A8J2QG29_9NEOP|nr:unnamed protein product [Danaus chrysippus]
MNVWLWGGSAFEFCRHVATLWRRIAVFARSWSQNKQILVNTEVLLTETWAPPQNALAHSLPAALKSRVAGSLLRILTRALTITLEFRGWCASERYLSIHPQSTCAVIITLSRNKHLHTPAH